VRASSDAGRPPPNCPDFGGGSRWSRRRCNPTMTRQRMPSSHLDPPRKSGRIRWWILAPGEGRKPMTNVLQSFCLPLTHAASVRALRSLAREEIRPARSPASPKGARHEADPPHPASPCVVLSIAARPRCRPLVRCNVALDRAVLSAGRASGWFSRSLWMRPLRPTRGASALNLALVLDRSGSMAATRSRRPRGCRPALRRLSPGTSSRS